MHIDVITVPYHLGHSRIGMGNGPDELIRAGLIEMLVSHGHQTELRKVTLPGRAANEIDGSFALQHLVAEQVAVADRRDALPVTLAGNCNYAAVGTVGGLNHDVGVVWFDAHSDFATPETTESGFLDGMGMSMLTGGCWAELRKRTMGSRVIPEERMVLVGLRHLSILEQDQLDQSAMRVITPTQLHQQGIEATLNPLLDFLRAEIAGIYLHLDLDVLDPTEGRANPWAAPDGLTLAEVEQTIAAVGRQIPIHGVGVTAYDPSGDPDGTVARAAIRLISTIAQAADSSVGDAVGLSDPH